MTHFLSDFLDPKSVAFLGASNNITTMGTGQIYSLKSRFTGKIYPIHPTEEKILGLKAFKDLTELPEVPDLLIVVLPTRIVEEYLEKAGKIGINYVIIISAGFSEVGKTESQERLNEIAKRYNMRFIGPNCFGVVNTHGTNGILNCTWVPFELPEQQKGTISLVSQSGSWISQTLIWAERRGLRIGKGLSVGNEANIDLTEYLEYLKNDPNTQVIGMYLEGIKKNGRKFVKTLKETAKEKPVIISYHGGTKAGSRAGMSHTASLGGSLSIYNSIFKQTNVIAAENMEQLFEYTHAFSVAYPPQGKRIGLITNSGGPAVTLADLCEKEKLVVPEFSTDLIAQLREIIPPVASPNNPIDLTFDLNLPLFYNDIPKLIWESGEVDALIFYGIFGNNMLKRAIEFNHGEFKEIFPLEVMDQVMGNILNKFSKWIHRNKIPVLISCIDTADNVVKILNRSNIPVFKWPSMTVKAMRALIQYYCELNNF
ncbi:MAG: acetate--CoA ligase family protein [Candidatus Hodarchaeales archaeon]|jgi:acetyltransferase